MVRGRSRPLPPTSTSSTSYAAIAAFATAAVGMMDDLVDNEEKNHQVSQLALESTVEDLKLLQNISRSFFFIVKQIQCNQLKVNNDLSYYRNS